MVCAGVEFFSCDGFVRGVAGRLLAVWPRHARFLASLPLGFLALAPTLLGLGWALSALGVYFRDLAEIVGLFMGMLLFLTPVFFPLSVLPDFLQTWVGFNPLAVPIEALRSIGLMGQWPNFANLLMLFGAGVGLAMCSAWLFEKSRKGFADVL